MNDINFELTAEEKQFIIVQELKQFEGEMYRLGLRHRVQKRLDNKAHIKQLEKDMENLEAAMDEIKEEWDQVKAMIPKPKGRPSTKATKEQKDEEPASEE